MELLQSPPALLLYLAAAGLAARGAIGKGARAPALLGGLCWCVGTLAALVDGVPLEAVLCAALALLLISTSLGDRGRRADEL